MAASNIADIGIRVYLDDAASLGLGALNSNLQGIGLAASLAAGSWSDLSAQMMSTAALLGLMGAFFGLATAMYQAVQNASDMQTLLIQIQRATNGTTEQMQQMQDVLMNIGGSSIYSLQQLADGFVLLGQRGVSAADIINSVGLQMTYLAEATGTQPVEAAGLLASTLASFNISASHSAQVVDLLQFAFEHGVPSVSELTSAMAKIGSVATELKIPLDQVIPAIDVLSRAMGSGSLAATALYYFLGQLRSGTSTYKDEIAKLGISFYDAQGNFIGLNQAITLIYNTLKGLNTQDLGQALSALFNIKAGQGIGILLADLGQVQALSGQLATSMDNAGMATYRAGQIANSTAGLWHSFTSNLQDWLTLGGKPIIDAIQPMLMGFRDMSAQIRQVVQADAPFIASTFLLATAITGLTAVIMFGSTALGLFTLIALGVVVGVSGIVAVAILIQMHWSQVIAVLQRLAPIANTVGSVLLVVGAILLSWQVIPLILSMGRLAIFVVQLGYALYTLIPPILAGTGAWLANAAATMLALLPYILIGAVIAGAIIGLILLVQHLGAVNVAVAFMRAVWAALLPSLQAAATEIRGAFMQAIQQLTPVWNQLVQAFNQARPALLALGIVLGVILMVALAVIVGAIRALVVILTVLITTAIHVVAAVIQVFAGLVQFFMGLFTVIHGIFTGNTGEILAGFRTMGQGILNIFQGLWSAVVALFIGTFSLIGGVVSAFIGGILGFFRSLWSQLVGHSIIPDMLNTMLFLFIGIGPAVIGAFGNMIGGLVGLAMSLGGRIIGAVGNLGSALFGAGQSVIQGLINGIQSMIGNLIGAASNALSFVRDLFPHSPAKAGPLVDLHTWMPNVVKILSDTTTSSAPALHASMSAVAGGIKSSVYGAGGGTGGPGKGMQGETYTLTIDGKAFLSFFHDQLTGQLQANGVGRLMR